MNYVNPEQVEDAWLPKTPAKECIVNTTCYLFWKPANGSIEGTAGTLHELNQQLVLLRDYVWAFIIDATDGDVKQFLGTGTIQEARNQAANAYAIIENMPNLPLPKGYRR